jgi:hypothetical protein
VNAQSSVATASWFHAVALTVIGATPGPARASASSRNPKAASPAGVPYPFSQELPQMIPPARTPRQRKQDTLDRLGQDVDAWVASADPATGTPWLIPLSFLWDGHSLLVATPAASPTGRNLQATGRVRLGIGPTRDLVLIEGTVDQVVAANQVPAEVGDAFAAKAGFDPRELITPYLYFRIRPQRVQAWREVNELAGRDLMRDGQWEVPG